MQAKFWVPPGIGSYLIQRALRSGVAAGPINSIETFVNSEHVAARQMLTTIDHPEAGEVRVHSFPVKMSETPATIERTAPHKGQHSREILQEWLGLDNAALKRLEEDAVV